MLVCDQDWPKGRAEGGGGHKTGNSINLLAHWRLKNDGVISALGLRCLIRSYFCCKRKQLTQDTGVETTVKKPLDSIENRDLEVVNNPNPSPGGLYGLCFPPSVSAPFPSQRQACLSMQEVLISSAPPAGTPG